MIGGKDPTIGISAPQMLKSFRGSERRLCAKPLNLDNTVSPAEGTKAIEKKSPSREENRE